MSRPRRRRAPNGRGTYGHDAHGYWAKISLGKDPVTGRPVRITLRAATMRQLQEQVEDTERKRAAVRRQASTRLTVGEWVTMWLASVERACKPKTHQTYQSLMRAHVSRIAAVRLDRLTPERIEGIYDDILATGTSAVTVSNLHRTLRACLNEAVRRGHLPANPVQLARPPRVERTQRVPLTTAQSIDLLTAAAATDNTARWWVALAMGLRQGEALGLQYQDIDLDQKTILVRRALARLGYRHGCTDPLACAAGHHTDRCRHRSGTCAAHAYHCPKRKGGLVVGTPKTGKSERMLAIPEAMVAILVEHRARHRRRRLAQGLGWGPDVFVFSGPKGGPMDPRKDLARWKQILAESGLPDIRLHDARHTTATLMLTQHVSPREVMDYLGWTQIALLARYQHVLPEQQRAIAQGMSDALTPTDAHHRQDKHGTG